MNQTETRKIRVYGIVQGVGFRPTVSRMRLKITFTEASATKGLMWRFLHRVESTGGWFP